MRSKKKIASAVAVLAAAALVMACGSGTASAGPKRPPGWQRLNLPKEDVRPLWTWCDHGNRLYSTDTGSHPALAVAAGDPSCAGR